MLHLQFPRCCIFATLWHKYCHYVNKNWWQDFVIWCKDWYVYVWWLAVTNRCSVQICCMILCLSPRLKIWKVIKFIKNRVLGLFVCVFFFPCRKMIREVMCVQQWMKLAETLRAISCVYKVCQAKSLITFFFFLNQGNTRDLTDPMVSVMYEQEMWMLMQSNFFWVSHLHVSSPLVSLICPPCIWVSAYVLCICDLSLMFCVFWIHHFCLLLCWLLTACVWDISFVVQCEQ